MPNCPDAAEPELLLADWTTLKGRRTFRNSFDDPLDHEDEHTGKNQIQRQREHGNCYNRTSDTVAQTQHQNTGTNLTAGPHADGNSQAVAPVCLLSVAKRGKHLAKVADQSDQQNMQCDFAPA